MNPQLRDAIEGLYAAFERAAPGKIDGCPCCVHKVDRCVLISTPLRELSSSDLDNFAWKAMTTIGWREDFRRPAEPLLGGCPG